MGRPHEFREVGTAVRTRLWTRGVRLALAFGRYPALPVSLHADPIYESFFDFAEAAPEDAETARRFLAEQHAFQAETLRAPAADPHYETAPEALTRNRLLVGATDSMSLEICWGVTDDVRVPNVPTAGASRTELRIRPRGRDPGDLRVDPWPFAAERVALLCEGRRLRGRFSDETDMRRAPEVADSVVETVLRPCRANCEYARTGTGPDCGVASGT